MTGLLAEAAAPSAKCIFMDRVSREVRSKNMSRIRSTGNRSTERRLRAALVSQGIAGWKLRPRGIVGNPDFVFLKRKLLVFVDGCFWHGCPVCGSLPRTNKRYWHPKIARTQARDARYTAELQSEGWTVLRFWEHELASDLAGVVARVGDALKPRKRQR